MLRFGFESVCLSRSHPWLDAPPADEPLAGWAPADFVAGGMAVIPRIPLTRVDEESLFAAYLDHPLIVYGHHGDLADGVEVLDHVARRIDSLGPVRWSSPSEIARSNYLSRIEGSVLVVRPLSRRLTVEIPAGVDAVSVVLPRATVDPDRLVLRCGEAVSSIRPAGESLWSEPAPIGDARTLEVSLSDSRAVAPYGVAAPRPTVWPFVRRTLAQFRDRTSPIANRMLGHARSRE
jgi:hypothetical protein